MYKFALATIVTGGIALTVAPESLGAHLSNFFDQTNELVDTSRTASCENHPVRCLKNKQTDLSKSLKELRLSELDLLKAYESTARELIANRELLRKNTIYLETGKKLIGTMSENEELVFAGKLYTGPSAIKAQLKQLFAERKHLEVIVANADAFFVELGDIREKVVSNRIELEAASASMPAKISLARVRAAYSDMKWHLSEVDTIVAGSSSTTGEIKTILRTTREMVDDERSAQRLSQESSNAAADFEDWLRQPNLATGQTRTNIE